MILFKINSNIDIFSIHYGSQNGRIILTQSSSWFIGDKQDNQTFRNRDDGCYYVSRTGNMTSHNCYKRKHKYKNNIPDDIIKDII